MLQWPLAAACAAACVLAVSDLLTDGARRIGRRAAGWASASARPATRRWQPPVSAVPRQLAVTVRRSCARGTGSRRATSLAERGDVAGELVEPRRRGRAGRRGRPVAPATPLLDAVERVLDPLEALGDRAQPAGEALDVGRRRDVERPHRGLLRLDRLLARLEGARERAVDDRVRDQLLGELAERLLALPGEPVDEVRVRSGAAIGGRVHQPNRYTRPARLTA